MKTEQMQEIIARLYALRNIEPEQTMALLEAIDKASGKVSGTQDMVRGFCAGIAAAQAIGRGDRL